MIAQALLELIGTFVFLSIILATNGNAIAVGIGLTAMVFLAGAVSGAHFNPAVTLMQTLGGKINGTTAIVYVIVQILGAIAALSFSKFITKN